MTIKDASDDTKQLMFQLTGPFCVRGADGTNCTPKGRKAQGLLALLACTADMTRGRSWLQDKLWSDRSREQGSASLRQTLSEIRRGFGPYRDAIVTRNNTIQLDPQLVSVICEPNADREFLEGLDIRDTEFDDWLRQERSSRSNTVVSVTHAPPISSFTIYAPGSTREDPMAQMLEQVFLDSVVKGVTELQTLNVTVSEDQSKDYWAKLQASGILADRRAGLHATWHFSRTTSQRWSGTRVIPMNGAIPVEDPMFLQLVNEAVENLSEGLSGFPLQRSADLDTALLTRSGQRCLFSMSETNLLKADDCFKAAFEASGRGIHLAWRSMVRLAQLIERTNEDEDQLRAEIEELSARALELEPMNSMVLACAANTKLLTRHDVDAGSELSRKAVAVNPSNPFAWDSLSTSAIYSGNLEEAHRLALTAQQIASTSPFKPWFDMACCLTATAIGDLDLALRMAGTSHALAPSFRPPLRYQIALLAAKGEIEKSVAKVQELAEIERDFTAEQMFQDSKYPVATLRISGLDLGDLFNRLD